MNNFQSLNLLVQACVVQSFFSSFFYAAGAPLWQPYIKWPTLAKMPMEKPMGENA